MHNNFRVNNFDILRLVAASQVAIYHAITFLEIEHDSSIVFSALSLFPGVPVFFFVSGFLISKSYENNSHIREYAQNRILRIFPALIICTFVSLLSIYLTGYLADKDFSAFEFVFWIFGQISFFQFYNPEFMRGFGTGVMNGSLWTITVELQFYIMVPILYWAFGLEKGKNANRKLFILLIVFMVFHATKPILNHEFGEALLFKLYGVSFIPWIWMFLMGVLFQKNFDVLHKILAGKVLYVLPIYLIISTFSTTYLGWSIGNGINPILYVALAMLIFSFAYSFANLSQSLLKRNDISYGVYIYHIPVINILIYYGYTGKSLYLVFALIVTILLAGLSWFLFEKNIMKLKKHPFNPLRTINNTVQSNTNDRN